MFCMRAPHVVCLSLALSFRPRNPCGRPFCCLFLANPGWRSFILLSPPYLARAHCCLCDLRPWPCRVGSPNDLPVFGHENTAFFCGCGLAGTPLHVPVLGLEKVECSVYVPRLCRW